MISDSCMRTDSTMKGGLCSSEGTRKGYLWLDGEGNSRPRSKLEASKYSRISWLLHLSTDLQSPLSISVTGSQNLPVPARFVNHGVPYYLSEHVWHSGGPQSGS